MSENTTTRFSERRKMLTVREDAFTLAGRIRASIAPEKEAELRSVLNEQHPADLADAMQFLSESEEQRLFALLDTTEAAEVLDELDATTEAGLLRSTSPDRLADILEELLADEGADVVGGLLPGQADTVLALTDPETAADIRTLLAYGPETAGGIMSLGYVDVPEDATQAQALDRFREKADAEHIFFVYVVNATGGLQGVINLRKLLTASPTTLVRDLMSNDYVSVPQKPIRSK